ncbi:MAG TPA: ParM/StbA family protein [Chitinophaga sp.]|uniref:ParM/StbA family protein n=1 Tax=Chitinophaga sp. TaxID=1869181 RepID=UPI002C5FB4C4|nr:ParM/StbA family protein [Chitinophaga sp.]HVI49562.1 ParM/StbA family protein [Chitinophaga sp.]
MKVSTISFPSVFETAFGNTENSSKDLLNGLKIKKDDSWYLVGNLAKRGGINPSRITNASPNEEDYEILFKAAMLNTMDKVQQPIAITMGFPFSTYNIYKTAAEQFLSKRHFLIDYDTQTFNNKGSFKKGMFDIEKYEVIPEIVGGIIGLKKTINAPQLDNFIAVSFGFGTIEGGMATGDGLVHRTCFSSHGIRYAINNLTRELNQKHYLEMKNEHQVDDAFMKGSIFTNRKRIDLREMRKSVLTQYYKEVVSPLMRTYFTDLDFETCEKIYLMGGGAHYRELTDAFVEEFRDFVPVEVAPDPEKLISIGYLYNSLRISDTKPQRCVGLDLGNSSSIISTFENEHQPSVTTNPVTL